MQRTIVTALFSKRNEAEDAFHDLRQAGFALDRIGMEPQHLLRRSARERPADRGRIEAARKKVFAVGRNRNGADRSAMAGELGLHGMSRNNQHSSGGTECKNPLHRCFNRDLAAWLCWVVSYCTTLVRHESLHGLA